MAAATNSYTGGDGKMKRMLEPSIKLIGLEIKIIQKERSLNSTKKKTRFAIPFADPLPPPHEFRYTSPEDALQLIATLTISQMAAQHNKFGQVASNAIDADLYQCGPSPGPILMDRCTVGLRQ